MITIVLAFLDKSVYEMIDHHFPILRSYEGMQVNKEDKSSKKEVVGSLQNADPMTEMDTSYEDSFCNSMGDNAEKMGQRCKVLSKPNCQNVNCCVLLNGTKCVAGSKDGPLETVDLDEANDYYYYKTSVTEINAPNNNIT